MTTFETKSYEIQKSLASKGYSFDPVTIITLLSLILPLLMKCFMPDSPDQLKKYVSARYDASKDTYSRSLVRSVARRARQEAVDRGKSLTFEEAKAIAIETLNVARTTSKEDIKELMAELKN